MLQATLGKRDISSAQFFSPPPCSSQLFPMTFTPAHFVFTLLNSFDPSQLFSVLASPLQLLPTHLTSFSAHLNPHRLNSGRLFSTLFTSRHRDAYTQSKLAHGEEAFTHSKLLHREVRTHATSFYPLQAFAQRDFYMQQAFTQRSFYTQKLLHTEAFSHSNIFSGEGSD